MCKKAYEGVEVKVKDHHCFTEKYEGSAHQGCNLNLSLSKKKSLMSFIICKTIIHILSFKKLENIISEKVLH